MGQTTLVSTLIDRVLTDLQQDPTDPVYWTRQETLDIVWEGLVEINLLSGYYQTSVTQTLTNNSLQGAPEHIAIIHVRMGTAALLKYSVDALDSQFPNWEDESAVAAPRRWAALGTNLFIVHPRTTTTGTVATIDVLQLADQLAETDIIPLDDEYIEALEKYVFHVARLKEGGQEFQQSLSSYQQFTTYAAQLSARVAWKDAPIWAYQPVVKVADAVPRPVRSR